MSAAGALLCVLAFWVAAALKTTDTTAQLVLIVVPAVVGLYLGLRTGLHGLTLPLYSIAMMLALAYARVYPYYSTDWDWRGPSMLYTCFLAPSAMMPVVIVIVIQAIRRRKNRPNQASHATSSWRER
jgi:hypothetical protein